VLLPRGGKRFDEAFAYLFNSYYEALGARQPRPQRGLITRPDCAETLAYRRHVDAAMEAVLAEAGDDPDLAALMDIGFAHEEQHQELILTDILHLFAQNPLKPAYTSPAAPAPTAAPAQTVRFDGGVVEVGHTGQGFAFDNEGPRHRVWLEPFGLDTALVTNAQWRAFVEDGGYRRADLWLSDGWAQACAEGWTAPLYWEADLSSAFGLGGVQAVDAEAPVRHVSYYEADAYARWAGARLPLESEWEHAATTRRDGFRDLFGQVWQWSASPYVAYPGFKPAAGAVGEYNGKFMINQMILRGSSVATPPGHSRPTYRNFFQPHQRWQFTGLRLARD
jgi:ergothioneine biosynthesis protein EgtB